MLPVFENGAYGGRIVKVGAVTGLDTVKKTKLDSPPPGPGFDTVTVAVLAAEMSEAKIDAVSRELVMKLVVRRLPFQFTTAPETNPVPCTVSVNPDPPGAALAGAIG